MDEPDYGKPLFGLLATFEEDLEELQDANLALRLQVESLEDEVRWARQDASNLRKDKEKGERERRSERERLCEWLDRRIAQQEQALTPSYVSPETKRVMEIEVSILRRYREIVVGSHHTKGSDDPLMPKFA